MKVKLYGVEGSSYDGCNGWDSWLMEASITLDKEEAYKYAREHSSDFVRTTVIDYKEIELDESKITKNLQ